MFEHEALADALIESLQARIAELEAGPDAGTCARRGANMSEPAATSPRKCADCGANEADPGVTVCTPCWDRVYKRPQAAAPARLDPSGTATGKTILTAPIVGRTTQHPGPASAHVDLETGVRTELGGAPGVHLHRDSGSRPDAPLLARCPLRAEHPRGPRTVDEVRSAMQAIGPLPTGAVAARATLDGSHGSIRRILSEVARRRLSVMRPLPNEDQ